MGVVTIEQLRSMANKLRQDIDLLRQSNLESSSQLRQLQDSLNNVEWAIGELSTGKYTRAVHDGYIPKRYRSWAGGGD